jgi:hypothetical protein
MVRRYESVEELAHAIAAAVSEVESDAATSGGGGGCGSSGGGLAGIGDDGGGGALLGVDSGDTEGGGGGGGCGRIIADVRVLSGANGGGIVGLCSVYAMERNRRQGFRHCADCGEFLNGDRCERTHCGRSFCFCFLACFMFSAGGSSWAVYISCTMSLFFLHDFGAVSNFLR